MRSRLPVIFATLFVFHHEFGTRILAAGQMFPFYGSSASGTGASGTGASGTGASAMGPSFFNFMSGDEDDATSGPSADDASGSDASGSDASASGSDDSPQMMPNFGYPFFFNLTPTSMQRPQMFGRPGMMNITPQMMMSAFSNMQSNPMGLYGLAVPFGAFSNGFRGRPVRRYSGGNFDYYGFGSRFSRRRRRPQMPYYGGFGAGDYSSSSEEMDYSFYG